MELSSRPPGLVGGHCIGVDPYYLTHKAEQIGFHPQMILASRRINDAMATYVANDVINIMIKRKRSIDQAPRVGDGLHGIKALLAPGGLIYDLKVILPPSASHARI